METKRTRNFTWPGLLLTIAATAAFAWALWQVVFWHGSPFSAGSSTRLSNAKNAYSRLSDIRSAQERYRRINNRYARFFIHLYRDVDETGKPKDLDLIPERLGFSRSPKTAWDGYYFADVHRCGQSDKEGRVPDSEWMVAAIPAKPGETGVLTLVACPAGVYAQSVPGQTLLFPCRPGPPDWVLVKSAGGLAKLRAAGGG